MNKSVQKSDFAEVAQLIEAARQRVNRVVNAELIDLYWTVGEYVSNKIASDTWGEKYSSGFGCLYSIASAGVAWVFSAKYLAHASIF